MKPFDKWLLQARKEVKGEDLPAVSVPGEDELDFCIFGEVLDDFWLVRKQDGWDISRGFQQSGDNIWR